MRRMRRAAGSLQRARLSLVRLLRSKQGQPGDAQPAEHPSATAPAEVEPVRVRIFHAADGWRWQVLARNNRLVAESGEAYTRRRDCVKAYERVMVDAPLTVDE